MAKCLIVVVLIAQSTYIVPIVPVVDIYKICVIVGVIKVKIMTEIWPQVWVTFIEIILVKKIPEWIQVPVIGSSEFPAVIKGNAIALINTVNDIYTWEKFKVVLCI